MKPRPFTPKQRFFFILWLSLVLIACNLGTSGTQAIPTLAPLASATPPPTLGFSGSGGDTNGGSVGTGNLTTPVADVSIKLYNMMQQVDIERLMYHVQNLQNFGTRHVNSNTGSATNGIGAARNYIYNEFDKLRAYAPNGSLHVERLAFDMSYNNIPTRQENIVAVLQGVEPGAGFLVIGAHYDSIGPDFSDATGSAPGANDNGTGVAALMELARVMGQQQFRASIIFVAFSAEEVDRRGSRAFVNWAKSRNLDIVSMINLDSIGNTNDRTGKVDASLRIFSCEGESICTDGGKSRNLARAVEFLGFAHNAVLPMSVESVADREGRYGDHFSFSEQGYPAIRFISTLEEWPNGSARDTIEYVERDYFRQSVQSIMMIAVALADGLQPPRQITVRNTDGGMSLVWESVPNATGYTIALRLPNQQRYDHQLDCTPQTDYCKGTTLTWSGLGAYAGVAIASRGPDGLLGRLSLEYVLQQGR